MKKILYILAAIVISITGCEKEENKEKMMLSGRILKDCSGVPLANFGLEAIVSTRRIVKATDYYYFDTDANGNFNLLIEEIGTVVLRAAAGAKLLDDIPGTQSELNLGTFMASPSTSFVYRIKVNNPYNVGDTLYFSLPPFTPLKGHVIAAPLQDSTFGLIQNYQQLASNSFGKTDQVEIKFGVTVSKNGFIRDSVYFSETKVFNFPACPSKIDTITIQIN
ncbi:MAG: hypothetical protein K0B10_15040 [Vicingaceae bacterium]|nr:hypothetical protein [Vicingaceae bacterium]